MKFSLKSIAALILAFCIKAIPFIFGFGLGLSILSFLIAIGIFSYVFLSPQLRLIPVKD